MNTPMGTEEVDFKSFSGYLALVIALAALVAVPVLIGNAPRDEMGDKDVPVLFVIGSMLVFGLMMKGLYILQPNQSALMMLFGSYRGTDYSTGLRWANPFLNKMKVSVRLRNFNSEKLKVNDQRGNPIEIAAAIVWRVEDTARAKFDVEDFEAYVLTQAEAAVRHLASSYAYDNFDDPLATKPAEVTLRSGGDEIGKALRDELQVRFALAGIEVIDAKL